MIAVVPAREVAPEFTAAAAGAEDCQVAECASRSATLQSPGWKQQSKACAQRGLLLNP